MAPTRPRNRIWSVVIWYPWDGKHMRKVVLRERLSFTQAGRVLREHEALGRKARLEAVDPSPEELAKDAERERAKSERAVAARARAERAKAAQGDLWAGDRRGERKEEP